MPNREVSTSASALDSARWRGQSGGRRVTALVWITTGVQEPGCSRGRHGLWPLAPDPSPGVHAEPMGYVVFGAGAIGAVVGGRLFQAGFDVTLTARGAHLRALQANGLRLQPPAGDETVAVASVGHPREVDWGTKQVVVMAVKSQHSLAALSELAEVAPPETRSCACKMG